jgi:hypothetical protein
MDIAFNHSEDRIPLTTVKMARSRGRRDDYSVMRNRHFHGGEEFYAKPPKWKTLITLLIIAVMVGSLFLLWRSLNSRLQKYTPFTRTAEVAELTILKTREGEDQLRVSLTLVNAGGFYKTEAPPQLLQGDEVILRYEYILVPAMLGFLGLHSGYLLISLVGLNKNSIIVSSWHLNEADNDNSVPARMYAFLVASKYDSIILMPSRSVYKLCITQTGLLKEC